MPDASPQGRAETGNGFLGEELSESLAWWELTGSDHFGWRLWSG